MGYAALGTCHETAHEAGQALCATYPDRWGSGESATVDSCTAVNVSGALTITRTVNGQAAQGYTLAPTYPECTPPDLVGDLVALWSLGLVLLTTIWCWKAVFRPLLRMATS